MRSAELNARFQKVRFQLAQGINEHGSLGRQIEGQRHPGGPEVSEGHNIGN